MVWTVISWMLMLIGALMLGGVLFLVLLSFGLRSLHRER